MSTSETLNSFQPGSVIETETGRLEIVSELGRGGMGIVLKAHEPRMDRMVAIKVFNSSASSRENIKRFTREAKLAAQVNHPSIVKVFNLEFFQDIPFIVMEYVEGKVLSDIVSEKGKLSDEEVRSIFTPVLRALSEIHDHDLVHRDIKPGNIIVTADGTTKLMDFGIAKDIGEADAQRLTSTGMMLGSPAYMSPEQCNAHQLDARSDIYSVGCTLYEALTGKPPYQGESLFDVIYQHSNADVPIIPNSSLAGVVAKAMQKDPSDRFQTAKEFGEALESGAKVVVRRKHKLQKRLIITIGAGLAIATGLLAFAFKSSLSELPQPTYGVRTTVHQIAEERSRQTLGRFLDHADAWSRLEKLNALIDSTSEYKANLSSAQDRSGLFQVIALLNLDIGRKDQAMEAWTQSLDAADYGFRRDDQLKTRATVYHDAIESMLYYHRFPLCDKYLDRLEETVSKLPNQEAWVQYTRARVETDRNGASPATINLLQQAVRNYREAEPGKEIDLGYLSALTTLAKQLEDAGQLEDAKKYLEDGLERSVINTHGEESQTGRDFHMERFRAADQLTSVLAKMGKGTEFMKWLGVKREILNSATFAVPFQKTQHEIDMLNRELDYAANLYMNGDAQTALLFASNLLPVLRNGIGTDLGRQLLASDLVDCAGAAAMLKKTEDADKYAKEAETVLAQIKQPTDYGSLFNCEHRLGIMNCVLRRGEKAREHFEQALKIAHDNPNAIPPDHVATCRSEARAHGVKGAK